MHSKLLKLFSLSCVLFFSYPVQAMTFKLAQVDTSARCGTTCPLIVQAEGSIGKDTATEFVEFLKTQPRTSQLKAIVFMNSPGGVLEGAMKLGFVFRQLKLTVAIAEAGRTGEGSVTSAQCYSACVYALMGGKKRIVPLASKVGIHSIFTNRFEFDPLHAEPPFRKVPAPTSVNDVARKYTKYMGVSEELVNLGESVSPSTISILTPAQIAQFRLGVQRLK